MRWSNATRWPVCCLSDALTLSIVAAVRPMPALWPSATTPAASLDTLARRETTLAVSDAIGLGARPCRSALASTLPTSSLYSAFLTLAACSLRDRSATALLILR